MDEVPQELLSFILQNAVRLERDYYNASLVCKEWHKIVLSSHFIWFNLFKRRWPEALRKVEDDTITSDKESDKNISYEAPVPLEMYCTKISCGDWEFFSNCLNSGVMEERKRGRKSAKKQKGSRQGKHYESVEELVQKGKKQKTKGKKRAKRTQLTTFDPVTSGTFKWLGTQEGGGVVGLKRGSSPATIFLKLAPEAVVKTMLNEWYTVRKKGEKWITEKDVYKYWAIRIYMQGKRLPHWVDYWSEEYMGEERLPMGRDAFQRLQKVWLCPAAVKELNKASEGVIVLPEVLNIDEKLSPFKGLSPYLRHIPNKDPPDGHWITETTIKASSTQLPFLLNCYPVQQTEGPTMLEFFEEALGNLDPEQLRETIIIADPYYIDDGSRTWLRGNGCKYLLSVNPTRFSEVWVALSSHIDSIGDWVVAWSEETQEAALIHWHETLGKIYILTNAFSYVDDGKPLDQPPFEAYYKVTFNFSDQLNHIMHNKKYPYHRPKWQYNFDDFHFTALLWNTYVLWHECNPKAPRMEWAQYCMQLANGLWEAFIQ